MEDSDRSETFSSSGSDDDEYGSEEEDEFDVEDDVKNNEQEGYGLDTTTKDDFDDFPESIFGADEKKRLEKQRDLRRKSLMEERDAQREGRVIFMRMKEKMTPEQLRRIRMIMAKLIAMSPPIADDQAKLAKAFVIWSQKLPLFLKCTELKRQLDERGIALENIRDSYYRDVLSVKQHVEKIYQDKHMPLELKELNGAVPSIDLRKMVERSYTSQSSNQLRDGLMSTDLVTEKAKKLWGVNPWEQGHAYQVYKRINPERLRTGGASLNLYAPCRHRLYIKYCRSCIGVMLLVHDWNQDVEAAFNIKMVKDTNDELRKVIDNLNGVILDLSQKLKDTSEDLNAHRKGAKWWEDWAKKQTVSSDAEFKIKQLRSLSHQWENIARMSAEDSAAKKLEFQAAQKEASSKHEALAESMQNIVSQGEEDRNTFTEETTKLQSRIQEMEEKERQHCKDTEKMKMDSKEVLEENQRLKRINAQLIEAVDEKDRNLSQYREESVNKIEMLTSQINALTAELESAEKRSDELADMLENEKEESRRYQDLAATYEEDIKTLKNEMSETVSKMEEMKNAAPASDGDSDDDESDSESITEEVVEEYKQALDQLPRSMRVLLANRLEGFAGMEYEEEYEEEEEYGAPERGSLTESVIPEEDEEDFESKEPVKHIEKEGEDDLNKPINRKMLLKRYSSVLPDEEDKEKSNSKKIETSAPSQEPEKTSLSSANPPSRHKPRPSIAVKHNRQMSFGSSAASVKPSIARKRSSLSRRTVLAKFEKFDEEKLEALKREGIRKANAKKNAIKLLPMLARFMRPKMTFKVIATAVRFVVRFRRALEKHNFHLLGDIGRREEIRRVHKEYENYPFIIRHLEEKVNEFAVVEEDLRNQIDDMSSDLKKVRRENFDLVARVESHEADMDGLRRDINRQHIIAQCQRSLASELAETLALIRNRIHLMIQYEGDIPVSFNESDAKKLNSLQEDKSLQSQASEAKYIARDRLRKLRMHFKEVFSFVQDSRKLSPVSPFALGRFHDFYSFGSKHRNELRNLKIFRKRVLLDLSTVEKRWVVKTLKVYTSETKYRDLFFSMLCPECLDQCQVESDGSYSFSNKSHKKQLGGKSGEECITSPQEIKAMTDRISDKVRKDVEKEFEKKIIQSNRNSASLQDNIDQLSMTIEQLQKDISNKEATILALQRNESDLQEKHDISMREIYVLRTAVQDSYRVVEDNAIQNEIKRKRKLREKGTQISCSVCAIRYEKTEHGHEGDLTLQPEEEDRVIFPRAHRYYQRVKEVESLLKRNKPPVIAFEYKREDEAPEKPLAEAKHHVKEDPSSRPVDTRIGDLTVELRHAGGNRSKFSLMKQIPPNKKDSQSNAITKSQALKVASLLQNDAFGSKGGRYHGSSMFNLLASSSRNNLESAGDNKSSRRPISAPPRKVR